jgi:hypothetical protein
MSSDPHANVEGVLRRRPSWAKLPPAPMQPKIGQAPANPYAYKNRTEGGGYDDWASPSQVSLDVDPVKAGFVDRDVPGSGEFVSKGQGGTGAKSDEPKKTWSERNQEKSQSERGRALKGGETAQTNQEDYKGGQFLPSTDKPKSKRDRDLESLAAGTGRSIIEPAWANPEGRSVDEYPPTPLHRSIFQLLADHVRASGEGREYLDVPYSQRQKAKDMGAKFDWDKKQWYLEKEGDPGKLELIPDHHTGGYEGIPLREITRDTPLTPGVKGVLSTRKSTVGELIDAYNRGERWIEVQLPDDVPEEIVTALKRQNRRIERAREAPGHELTPQLKTLESKIDKLPVGRRGFARTLIERHQETGKLTENMQPWVQRLIDIAGDSVMTDWASPTQAEDWHGDWRPPTWDDDKAQDRQFREDDINRDKRGKWAAQRQLPRARTKDAWRSPRQDEPAEDERAVIEDARLRALDYARQLIGSDVVRPTRLAGDSARGMAFDRALHARPLRSQLIRMAVDFQSARSFSPDGHMHVTMSNISRASVNPYLGREIPNSEELGLKPNEKYMLLRHPDELRKAAATFNGIPLLIDHRPVAADDHPHELVVGSTGDNASYVHPFLRNSLHIWDQNAIDAIKDRSRTELSSAYHYVPVVQSGVYEGNPYQIVMTDIVANHLSLVETGRAGHAVTVADAMPFDLQMREWLRY